MTIPKRAKQYRCFLNIITYILVISFSLQSTVYAGSFPFNSSQADKLAPQSAFQEEERIEKGDDSGLDAEKTAAVPIYLEDEDGLKGSPAELLKYMYRNEIFCHNPKKSKEMANQRGGKDSLRTIQRELKVLKAVGLVHGNSRTGYYLANWVVMFDPIEIIRENPGLRKPNYFVDEKRKIRISGYRVYPIPFDEDGYFIPSNSEALSGFKWDFTISVRQIEPVIFIDSKGGVFFLFPPKRSRDGKIQHIVYKNAMKAGFDNLVEIREIHGSRGAFLTRVAQTYINDEIEHLHASAEDLLLVSIFYDIFDLSLRSEKNLNIRSIRKQNRYIAYDYDTSSMPYGITGPLDTFKRKEIVNQFRYIRLDTGYITRRIGELKITEEQRRLLEEEVERVLALIHAKARDHGGKEDAEERSVRTSV